MTSSLPMTVHSTLHQKLMCNTALTCSSRLATTLASQSVQRRLTLCTSQSQERHMLNPTSQSMGSNWTWWTSSPTLAAQSQETLPLMRNWMPDLLKQVLLLADSTRMCGNRRGITQETKIKVYQAIVLTALLYGYKLWMFCQCYARKLNHFHTTCLRKLLGIHCGKTRSQTLRSSDMLACRASIPFWCIHSRACNLHTDHWLPKRLFYGKLQ